MLEWLRWSTAAYEKDRHTFLTSMQLRDRDLVRLSKSAVNKPAYFIVVYHAKKYVVIGIRGTYNTTDILTDLCPHNEPFQKGTAHSGMLGAAKWLLENEGPVLKRLLAENSGYKLVLTGHSLGGGVAALLTMMIYSTSWSWFIPTSLGIFRHNIKCWGYGCAPCVDRTLAERETFIRNVVLQDDVVPRVNPAAIEVLREEIQDTSFSESVKGEKLKFVAGTMERIHVGNIIKSTNEIGVSVYQKLHEAYVEHGLPSLGCSSSDSSNSNMRIEGSSLPNVKMYDSDTSPEIAAKAIVAVANEPGASRQELEKRRLFVPGVLYHIRRQKIKREERMTALPIPARPFIAGQEAPRGSKYKYRVICGTDPSARFSRIIISKNLISDHSCYNIRDSILDALKSCS
nr:uncharacterized protein LOC112285327 isoform X2 [Physcomitrium patens]|eukprot:XP_024381806.1 uncharacterized protein LOC112285327 isoform X2 [Physcomitrella patens]